MGFGLGAFLLAVGLILALAVQDTLDSVDLTTVGWILTLIGLFVIALSAFTLNRSRGARNVATTTHSDGSQTISENRTDI